MDSYFYFPLSEEQPQDSSIQNNHDTTQEQPQDSSIQNNHDTTEVQQMDENQEKIQNQDQNMLDNTSNQNQQQTQPLAYETNNQQQKDDIQDNNSQTQSQVNQYHESDKQQSDSQSKQFQQANIHNKKQTTKIYKQDKYQIIKAQFQSFISVLPTQLTKQKYLNLYQCYKQQNKKNQIPRIVTILNAQKLFFLKLHLCKNKSLSRLIKFIQYFVTLAKKLPQKISEQSILQICKKQIEKNYLKFKGELLLTKNYSSENIIQLSDALIISKQVFWLSNIIDQPLKKRLNIYLQKNLEQSDKFLQTLSKIPNQLIQDKKNLVQKYLNNKTKNIVWFRKKQKLKDMLIQIIHANKQNVIDPICIQVCNSILWKQYNTNQAEFLDIINAVESQQNISKYHAFLEQILKFYFQGNKRGLNYIKQEAYKNLAKYGNFLRNNLQQRIIKYYSKITSQEQTAFLNKIIQEKNSSQLVNRLVQCVPKQKLYENLKDFYIGQSSNYQVIDICHQKYRVVFNYMKDKILQQQIAYQDLQKFIKYSKILQNKVKHLKKEAQQISDQLQKLLQKYKSLKQKILDIKNVISTINDQRANKLCSKLNNELKSFQEAEFLKDIKIPQQVYKILKKEPTLSKIRNIACFENFLTQQNQVTQIEWILSCIQKFQFSFHKNIEDVISKKFNVRQFLQYFNRISIQTLSQLLRNSIKKQQQENVIMLKNYLQEKKLKLAYDFLEGLKFLMTLLTLNQPNLQLNNDCIFISQILSLMNNKQNKDSDINIKSFEEGMSNLQNKLKLLKINQNYFNLNDNIAADVISKINEHNSIIKLAFKCTKNQLDSLVDFMVQDDNQIIGVVTQFSTVFRLTQKLKQATKVQQIIQITQEFTKQLKNQKQILSLNIQNCNAAFSTLEMKIEQSGDRRFSFKHQVQSILKKSTIEAISLDNWDSWEIHIKFSLDGKIIRKSLSRLRQFRDKTTFFIGEAKNSNYFQKNVIKSQVQKFELFQTFHIVFKAFQIIQEAINFLLQQGFPFQGFGEKALIPKQEKYLNFKCHQIFQYQENSKQDLIHKATQIKKKQQQWAQKIKQLWSLSYLASHLDGKKMKRLIHNIVELNKFDNTLETIFSLYQIPALKKNFILQNINQSSVNSIYNGYLQFFKSFGIYQKSKIQQSGSNSFLVYHEKEVNSYWIIFTLNPKPSVCDILFCSSKTKQNEVERFLIRAPKSNNYCFIVNSHKLDEKSEHILFARLTQMKQNKKIDLSNLVFIETRRDHRAFETLTSRRFNYIMKKFQVLKLNPSAIQDRLKPCSIVWSTQASCGKTYWIRKQIKKLNRTPKYLSLSGQIDQKYLSIQILNLNLNHQKDALVIQVSYTRNTQCMNQTLAQILLFRCLQVGISKIDNKIPIFIEIANLYNFKHFQKLPILQLVSKIGGFIVQIPKFNLDKIDIQQSTQLLYVGQMLRLIETKKINTVQFSKVSQLPANFKNLIKLYLFDPLNQNKEHISGFFYTNFMKKLYYNFKAFNQGFFKITILKFLGLQCTLRSNILQIIIKNTRDFLKQYFNTSMYSNEKYSKEDFSKKLRGLDLLILPLSGGGFSFIFSNPKSVPNTLKKYMLSQKKDKTDFQQDFCLSKMNQQKRYNEIIKRLKRVTGVPDCQDIKISTNYKLTQDNFFKMCIILYRIQSRIPIILMGESGVGKTSLITQLSKIIKAQLVVFQVHAGKRKKQIHNFIQNIIFEYKVNTIISSVFKQIECQIKQKGKQIIQLVVAIKYLQRVFERLQIQPSSVDSRINQVLSLMQYQNNCIKYADLRKIFKKMLSADQVVKIIGNYQNKNQKFYKNNKINLLVLIDEYNTSEEVYIFKQLIIDRRYRNVELPQGIVFMACCNPYIQNYFLKSINASDDIVGLKFNKTQIRQENKLAFKVEPPPESLRIITQDYQQLEQKQIKAYAQIMLRQVKNPTHIAEIISNIHIQLHKRYGRSSASLRDIQRFRILYSWFKKNCPKQHISVTQIKNSICSPQFQKPVSINIFDLDFQERIIIVALCACYMSKAQSEIIKEEIIKQIGESMKKKYQNILQIYNAEQIEFLKRMVSTQKIVLNKALRQNVFLMLICIMNKIANLTIGVPGCSKSLSISLIQSNLKGSDSKSDFYKKFPEVRIIPFQASPTSTSKAVQTLFNRAQQICIKMKKYENIVYVVMIDEIGLAQYSSDNPLKVLHSRLELTQRKYSVIGISNWTLDNAKASRFLICSRTLPSLKQLQQTSIELLKVYVPKSTNKQIRLFAQLSKVYYNFILEWRNNRILNRNFPEFFGLRDKYSFEKYIYNQLFNNNKPNIAQAINSSIKMNFDGQQKSVQTFINILAKVDQNEDFSQLRESAGIGSQTNPIQQCEKILNKKGSRCIMLIIPSDVLLPLINKQFKNSIYLHGSNFLQDKMNQDYNLKKIAQIISYVTMPNLIIMKDMNETIYTALYDLFNKNYTESGGKKYCRVASGANLNPRVEVSQKFNAILFVHQNDILNGKVDSAFLNRFCKIYFKLSRLLSQIQYDMVKRIISWLSQMLNNIVNKNSCLNIGNFFVNCSENALFSLAISLRQEQIQEKQEKMKEIIMRNKTFQVELATQHQLFKLPDTITHKQKQKYKNKIIYTYDLDCLFQEDILLQEQGPCRTVFMSTVRQQNSLNKIFEQFLNEKQKFLKIKLNYETHGFLFNQILFKIDEVIKTGSQTEEKIFIVIVFLKRNKISTQNPCISYLYPFEQSFISQLPRKDKRQNQILKNILNSKNYLEFYQSCHNKELTQIPENFIFSAFNRVRPIFKLPQNYIQKAQHYWNYVKQTYSHNKLFKSFILQNTINYCLEKRINKEFIQKYFKDNQIYSRSSNVVDSLRRYANKLIEDSLTAIILYIIKKGILFQFDRNIITELLQLNCKQITTKIKNCQSELNDILVILTKNKDKLQLMNMIIRRQFQSNQVELCLPFLFPYFQVQAELYYSLPQNQQSQNQSDNNLQSKIYELLVKSKLQYDKQQQNRGQIQALLKHSQDQFFQKSIFVKYQYNMNTQKSEIRWNYLQQFKKSQKLVQLFLYDIITVLYKKKFGGYQNLTQVYLLAISCLKQYTFQDAIIAISGDIEVIKTLSQLIGSVRLGGYNYSYQINSNKKNPVLFPKQQTDKLMKTFFEQNILMGNENTLKIFNSIGHYISTIPKVDLCLKKLEKQKHLKIKIPKQFGLICRWLMKMQKVVNQQKLNQCVKKLIQNNKEYGIYLSIIQISYQILENRNHQKNYNQQSKQLPDFYSFIGSKLFYFWYTRQIVNAAQDQDQEKGTKSIQIFFKWLQKWCNISNVFAQSIKQTLNQIFTIQQEVVEAIKYLRQFQQEEEQQQQCKIDQRIIRILNKHLHDHNSNLNIALNNFAYYNCKNFQRVAQQDLEQQWRKSFTKIKDTSKLNNLTSIFNFSFCKVLLKDYIQDIYQEQANGFTAIINNNLNINTQIAESLAIYGLKLLSKKFISFNQMKIWMQKGIAPWMDKYKHFFNRSFQLPDPPTVNLSQPFKSLIQDLVKTNFSDESLKKFFKHQIYHEQLYWSITTFMKHLYFGKLSPAHQRVKKMIQSINISKLAKHVIKCYCQKRVTEEFNIPNQIQAIQIQNLYYKQILNLYYKQFPFLNILNWFVAITETQNPLVNSFISDGEFPINFKQFIKNRHLICGIQSPYRRNIDHIIRFNNRDLGVYKCSTECDYIYPYSGCGFPAQRFTCKVCNKPSGGSHNLDGLVRGAKRLGPCLYYDSGIGKFTPQKHQFELQLYIRHLLNHQSYWKSFPFYLQEQKLQISNKINTKTQQGSLQLAGYRSKLQKHELDDIKRISSHTRQILRMISCIIMHFASKFCWIHQKQIKSIFQQQKKIFQKSQMEQAQNLYALLDKKIKQIFPWFTGITKQIFTSALNYQDQCKNLHKRKEKQIQQVISIAKKQKQTKKDYQARLISQIIIPDLQKFKKNIKYTWETTTVYSRQNFQQIVDTKINQLVSNQNQLEFIKNVQKIDERNCETKMKFKIDGLLLEIGQAQIYEQQYPFIRHISLVRQLPHQKKDLDAKNVQVWLENYLPQMTGYTLLQQIIKRPDISNKLENYKIILCFLNNILNICDRKINRQIAKTQKICDYFIKLPQKQQEKMKKDFDKFKNAWDFFVNQNGKQIQYNCKVLGKFSQLNLNKQLKYFLPDSRQDVKNTAGLAIHYALMLIAHDYNKQIAHLYKFSTKSPSKIKLDPGRVTQNKIVTLDLKIIQRQIEIFTNYSCSYGKTIGKVSYGSVLENIEDKFLGDGYHLQEDLSKIRQIKFQGQNMLSQKYTTCLEQLKRSDSQKDFNVNNQQQLSKFIETEKQHNQDGFYNKSRDCLDSLQIIMIYYRTFLKLTSKDITIRQFIQERKIQKQVSVIFENEKYCNLNICNLVALYELIQDSIGYKAQTIIPQQYKQQPSTQKWKICKKYIDQLNDENSGISLRLLLQASQRLILRRMLSFNPTMIEHTIGFSLTRLDFWPINFTQQSFYGMVPNLDIKVTNFYHFYIHLKQKFQKKVKKISKSIHQQQSLQKVEVVKKQQIQQNTKKKTKQVFKKVKRQQIDG